MGLDAMVWRSIPTLERMFGVGLFQIVDPHEREPDLKVGDGLSMEERTALHERIGNIMHVAGLREWIAPYLKAGDSIVQDRIIYSGSHAGDVLVASSFPRLKDELRLLRSMSTNPDVLHFVEQFERLIVAAEQEGNPIVF